MDNLPFRLLDLPDVALRKTLGAMTPIELWILATELKKCEHLIKPMKFDMTSSITDEKMIMFDWKKTNPDGPINKYYIISNKKRNHNEKEWRNCLSSFSKFIGRQIRMINWKTKDFKGTWEWINTDQSEVQNLTLISEQIEDPQETIRMLLDNSKLEKLKRFYFDFMLPIDFVYNGLLRFERPVGFLSLTDSSWLTVENVLGLNARKIILKNSEFSDQDLNVFSKHWMNADLVSNHIRILEIFKSDPDNIDQDVVLDGLQSNIRNFVSNQDGDAYLLERNDGDFVRIDVEKNCFSVVFFDNDVEQ